METGTEADRVIQPTASTSRGEEQMESGLTLTLNASEQTVEGGTTRPRLSRAQCRKLQNQLVIEKKEDMPVFKRGKRKQKKNGTPSSSKLTNPGTSTGKRVISLGSKERGEG